MIGTLWSRLAADVNRVAFYTASYFLERGGPPWHRARPIKGLLQASVEGPDALPPGRALDVGCGTGRNSGYLAEHGWNVVGIDVFRRPLRLARTRVERAGVAERSTFLRREATQLSSLPGPSFDLILDVYAAAGDLDLGRRAEYAAQVRKVIAPAGRFLIFTWLHEPEVLASYGALFRLERAVEGRDLDNLTQGRWFDFRARA